MKIFKNGEEIRSVTEWFRLAPPIEKEKHWVDGRSAKELAKAWFPGNANKGQDPHVPDELQSLLNSVEATLGTVLIQGEPECKVRFDKFSGPSNRDLQLQGECSGQRVSVSIEAKADESFDERYLSQVRSKNPRSNLPARLQKLEQILKKHEPNRIRYQLLHAIYAAMYKAASEEARVCVFVVHEFLSLRLDSRKINQNQQDLDYFISCLTGADVSCNSGKLLGPIEVPGFQRLPLFVGKAARFVTGN